jgi:hypothetical protein
LYPESRRSVVLAAEKTTDLLVSAFYFSIPVTEPKILFFDNVKVNPGQSTTFNCTVAAFPIPTESEIRLMGPSGRRIALIESSELGAPHATRINLFQVDFVNKDDTFTCVVRSVSGQASRTVATNVYGRAHVIKCI